MLNDSELKTSVLAALGWEPSINSAHIGVTAEGGIVTLTGHVDNYASKLSAETAVGRVKGVRAIVEELEVRLPSHMVKGDEAIAGAAVNRFFWSVAVPHEMVKVKVQKGWVTLTGDVDWHFQKDAASREIRELSGVIGITDLIAIKARVDVKNLGRDIDHALHRSCIDRRTIIVRADGGKVILSGTARSWSDREDAESTAWAARGATGVENDIAIV